MRLLFLFCFVSFGLFAQSSTNFWKNEMVEYAADRATVVMSLDPVYTEQWHELAQPQFWRQIMKLSPDTFLVNVASTREIIAKMAIKDWKVLTEIEKTAYKDNVKSELCLDSNERIFLTSGKNDFYRFHDVYPDLTRGVIEFDKNGVDPWYAQAILMIESPGQLKKSSVGAYGAFQLMPSVARAQGLTVNKTVDERTSFERSAYGAARLIRTICIPEAKRILEANNVSYQESDLWFRLFVLHVYHAGAMNVKAVVTKIGTVESGKELLQKMWVTSAASFGNNSQNYTQLALAAQLILHEMIVEKFPG